MKWDKLKKKNEMLGSRYVMAQLNELLYVRDLPKLQRQSFSTRFVDARVQLQQWRGDILVDRLIFKYSNSITVLVIKPLLYFLQLHSHTSTEVSDVGSIWSLGKNYSRQYCFFGWYRRPSDTGK